jgi:hypothetical protein
MNFDFDTLSKGSKFHKAEREGSVLLITPADESQKCLVEFQDIIDEAMAHAASEGYRVKAPRSRRRSIPGWRGPVYDLAIIYLDDRGQSRMGWNYRQAI